MHRGLIAVLLLAASSARADDNVPATIGDKPAASPAVDAPLASERAGDQEIGAATGIAIGGRVTPGGLRIAGHYLYQLTDQDWFDGGAEFTFGSGDPACFRDREDLVVCDHGLADGTALELSAGVRRMLGGRGAFRPFLRAAIGLAYVRFGDDDISGIVVPLHAGFGLRMRAADGIAVVAFGELTLGFGRFGKGLGAEPQLGLAVTAGAEFRLP